MTGETVEASWHAEQARLRPLPARLPVPFDVAVTRTVQRDCTVSFEGHVYSVPFRCCGRAVEVPGPGQPRRAEVPEPAPRRPGAGGRY